MKGMIAYLTACLLMASVSAAASDTTSFFRIRLDQDIDKSASKLIELGIRKAEKDSCDFILLDLDTYGGAVDAADSIRASILRCPIPVVAFVNMQAASAGALISIACDSIYMKTGSSIGAATVVDQNGKVMPDKYQSFMRGMMRSTAEAKGRDPHIAESMVDTAHVLSLTPTEAVKAGYCEGIYESPEEVAEAISGDDAYRITSLSSRMTWWEKLIQFLLNPVLQAIFLMMIVGGIYIEIRTPGIGIPLAIAIIGAFLYFSPLFIEHLAQFWEIALFIAGLILIGMEIFVIPGFGVCGISGIVAVVFSLSFAMIDNGVLRDLSGKIDLTPLARPMALVSVSSFVAVIGAVLLVRTLFATRSFDAIALRQSLDAGSGFVGVENLDRYMGTEVTVFSDLKPSGKVVAYDGRILEASLLYGGFASKGERLKVIRTEQGRLYVGL